MSQISRSSLLNTCLVFLLFLIITAHSSSASAASHACDTQFVSDGPSESLRLDPSNDMTGVTDTTNIQCALNAIENGSYLTVKLTNGSFYITELALACPSFKSCKISGAGKAGTSIIVVDDSVDCADRLVKRNPSAALTVSGNTAIQFLTIHSSSACMGGGSLNAVVLFTGAPAVWGGSCENSVINGLLDRVDVFATNTGAEVGVAVFPQSHLFPPKCQYKLLGTFTAIRAHIDGPHTGIKVSMHAGARVGMDFIETSNTAEGVSFVDSNMIANINFCTISGASTVDIPFYGVQVMRRPGAPELNNTYVYNCIFNISSSPGFRNAIGVFSGNEGGPAVLPISVTTSTFNLSGPSTRGVEVDNVSPCTIAGNRFNGNGALGVAIFAIGEKISGCSVTDNTGFATFSALDSDIFASDFTINNVLGYHPGADVKDNGCNFNLNDPGGSCAPAADDPL